jgi:formylglycine-generating enzyme
MIWLALSCAGVGSEYSKVVADLSEMAEFGETTFAMGYPDNEPGPYGNNWKETQQPQHSVSLSAYALDRTEVTVEAYAAFLNGIAADHPAHAAPHHHPLQPIEWIDGVFSPVEGEEQRPIRYVSWYDAVTYCSWRGKRLPTEAEWEQAVKGSDPEAPRSFPWTEGGANCQKAVYYTNLALCEAKPAEVGSRPEGDSPEGISDLAGNVSEWVSDWSARYTEEAAEDPQGPETGTYKLLRGGGFRESSDALRSMDRVMADPLSRSEGVGFRCAVGL